MNEYQKRFIALLKTIFELDKSDLDFGIYRIINFRHREIIEYFENKLPGKITDILEPFASAGKDELKQRMSKIEEEIAQMGITLESLPDDAPKKLEYISLERELAQGGDISALECDVYSALYSFFNRYYDEGDFISKRRYKEGIYAIPYEGEEVKLYWANQDQYYIKTSENFKDYSFVTQEGINVHFRLVDATTEQNNNKEADDAKRAFMLYTEDTERPELKTFEWNEADNELIIRFIYDVPSDKKKKYDDANFRAIKEWLTDYTSLMYALLRPCTVGDPKSPTIIEKHLKAYVAKNTFDYFIHKDLGGFLNRELDFFIKNEIMHLDDLDTDNERRAGSYIAKVRAVKRIGKEIISFLAQIENFQRKLWLKKKFVVETNWCITLDRIDESFYHEIIACKPQIQEWIDMYRIDEIVGDGHSIAFSNPPSIDFLKENPYLIVDTANFPSTFRDRLIATLDNIDENTGGLLVNGDNFQTLNLLQAKYSSRIDAVYIDPPYNTDSVPILYKNGYKDSSWLGLMYDRVSLGKDLLKETGIQCTAIDDYENANLNLLLKSIFGTSPDTVVTKSKPSGRPIPNGFAISHDYGLFNKKNIRTSISRLTHSDEQLSRYRLIDDNGPYFWEMLRKAGSHNTKEDRPSMFYPFYYNPSANKLRIPKLQYDKSSEEYNILENKDDDEILIYPVRDDGSYGCWYFGLDSIQSKIQELKAVKQDNGLYFVYYRRRPNDGVQPLTTWDEAKNSATEHGTGLIKKLFGTAKIFSYPKSLYTVIDSLRVSGISKDSIVLDYFAGSATTGHAALSLNRLYDWSIKYILAEMGEYFTTVTLPRVKKVIYSPEWKDGVPLRRDAGISQIVKYMRLESYEDSLSNIEINSHTKDGMADLFGEQYLISYMLDIETKDSLLNLDAFISPFDYEMNITEKNECRSRRVDIVETFNYLIGLSVKSQSPVRYFRAITPEKPAYTGAIDLKEDNNGEYAFRQLEGTLPDGRHALVIWRNIKSDNILASNAALDAYFSQFQINPRTQEFDVIYINGDSNVENLRSDNENWKVIRTEAEFNRLMWSE